MHAYLKKKINNQKVDESIFYLLYLTLKTIYFIVEKRKKKKGSDFYDDEIFRDKVSLKLLINN